VHRLRALRRCLPRPLHLRAGRGQRSGRPGQPGLFEFSFTNRQDGIYTKAELVVDDDGRAQKLPWEDWSDADEVERHTSAWMRATAPNGDADFEGIVAWAGELGYGERPAERGQREDDGTYADHVAMRPNTPEGAVPAASDEEGRH
jgi:hypothetical protein